MRTLRWTTAGIGLTLLAASLSCGEPSAGPGPLTGNATVSLVTPNPDDGALLLVIFGPGAADIRPANASYRVFSLTASPEEARVLVVGDLVAGPLLTLSVGDVNRIGDYHATAVEVASRSDEIRPTLLDYDLTFAAR